MKQPTGRVVTEEVPGREIALCHILSRPSPDLAEMLDFSAPALAILSVTPSEAAYVAADRITKAADVTLVFVDRYLGTLLVSGGSAALEAAVSDTVAFLSERLGIPPVRPTCS